MRRELEGGLEVWSTVTVGARRALCGILGGELGGDKGLKYEHPRLPLGNSAAFILCTWSSQNHGVSALLEINRSGLWAVFCKLQIAKKTPLISVGLSAIPPASSLHNKGPCARFKEHTSGTRMMCVGIARPDIT
ncbi:hypothetical protein FKM82_022565 [Ascaphus truei]